MLLFLFYAKKSSRAGQLIETVDACHKRHRLGHGMILI